MPLGHKTENKVYEKKMRACDKRILSCGAKLFNLAYGLSTVSSHYEYDRLNRDAIEILNMIEKERECFSEDTYNELKNELEYAIRSTRNKDFLYTTDAGNRILRIIRSYYETV